MQWLEHCPGGGGGGDLQTCRVNVEFTRVSKAVENDGTKCRRQTAGGPGGALYSPWTILEFDTSRRFKITISAPNLAKFYPIHNAFLTNLT